MFHGTWTFMDLQVPWKSQFRGTQISMELRVRWNSVLFHAASCARVFPVQCAIPSPEVSWLRDFHGPEDTVQLRTFLSVPVQHAFHGHMPRKFPEYASFRALGCLRWFPICRGPKFKVQLHISWHGRTAPRFHGQVRVRSPMLLRNLF